MEWGIGQWGRKVKQRQSGVRTERNIVRKEHMEGGNDKNDRRCAMEGREEEGKGREMQVWEER